LSTDVCHEEIDEKIVEKGVSIPNEEKK